MKSEKTIIQVFDRLFAELREQEGFAWKEAQGEVHLQYDEMPFWILLYENSSLNDALRTFQKIAVPYISKIEPLKITIAFDEFSDDGSEMIHHDFLDTNEAIIAGHNDWPLGQYASRRPFDGQSVFSSRDSKR